MRGLKLWAGLPAAAILTMLVPAAPASAQLGASLGGNPIAGLCLLSQAEVLGKAKVAAAADTQLKTLGSQAQAEVDGQRKPVEADIKTFQASAAGLKPDDRATREKALAGRLQQVQLLAQQRSRELELTRAKATQRILTEAQPVITQVYKQRNCGLLISRDAVFGGNMTNDLTAAVIQGLDAKLSTISLTRETLPAQAAPPQR